VKNILLDNDYFGPTEVEVLEEVASEEEEKYLYMGDLGLNENNVLFVDSSNIGALDY
jgi:hypothetical protein